MGSRYQDVVEALRVEMALLRTEMAVLSTKLETCTDEGQREELQTKLARARRDYGRLDAEQRRLSLVLNRMAAAGNEGR